MASTKKDTSLDMEDVLKAAKKFVKAGKLDELAEAWVENAEKAEEPSKLTNLLSEVGTFIKENDVEDKLEDFLTESTKSTTKKTSSTKKSTSSKKTSSTKKTSSAKKTSSSTKKSASTAKKSSSKTSSKKSSSSTKKSTSKTSKKTTSK